MDEHSHPTHLRWTEHLSFCNKMAEKINHPQFIAMLRQRLPFVANTIGEGSVGFLHLEVHALNQATLAVIRDGNVQVVKDHFAFVDEIYRNADSAVANALNVSYLEHIDFDGRKAKAIGVRELLTPRLQQEVVRLEGYWQALRRPADK